MLLYLFKSLCYTYCMGEYIGYQVVFFVLGFVFAWWISLFNYVYLHFFFRDSQ